MARFGVLLCFILPVMAYGQQQKTDTVLSVKDNVIPISRAIDIALANNTEIKRSLLDVKSADQDVRNAWSNVMPTIRGNMEYTRNMEIPVNFIPRGVFEPDAPNPDELIPVQFGTDNNWNGGFSATQNLFNGQVFVGISTSTLFKKAQSERFRQTAQQVVTQTRLAYYNVMMAEERYHLQKSRIERLRKNLEENRKRQKAGLVDRYEVLQIEVQLSNEQPKLTEARFNMRKAYRELKMTMGIPLDMEIQTKGDLRAYNIEGPSVEERENAELKKVSRMTPLQLDSTSYLMNKAKELRGDLLALEVQEKLKDKQILALKSQYLPTLTTTYNMSWRAAEAGKPNFFANDRQRRRTQTLMFNLRLPIFSGFSRDADITQQQIEQKDIRLQQKLARRQAHNEIQSAREDLRQALQTLSARKKALRQARRGYNIATARLQEGVGSQLDVTNAELELREAEVNYARMIRDFLSAKARYDKAIGMVPYVDRQMDAHNMEINLNNE